MVGYFYPGSLTPRGSQSPLEWPNVRIRESKMALSLGNSDQIKLQDRGWLATPTWVVVPIWVLPFVARLVVGRRLPMEHLDIFSSKVFWAIFQQEEGRPNANGEGFCWSAF